MNRLKALREDRGINQRRLADELNVSQAMISKYELGLSEPDIATIKRIAAFFGVSTDYLLEVSNDKINVSAFGLTDSEKDVLFGFKRLNDVQKEKLKAYLKGLLQD